MARSGQEMNGVWRVVETAIVMAICKAALREKLEVDVEGDADGGDACACLTTAEECRAAIRESNRETIRFFQVGQVDPENRPRRESVGWVEIHWGDGLLCLNDYSAGEAERITAPVRDLIATLDDTSAALGCQETALIVLLKSLDIPADTPD